MPSGGALGAHWGSVRPKTVGTAVARRGILRLHSPHRNVRPSRKSRGRAPCHGGEGAMSARIPPPLLGLVLTPSVLPGQRANPAQPAGPEPKPATPEQMKRWIEQLGDFHFDVRQQASDKLTTAGLAALPYLQEATASSDPEV